ncbi:hypothetical protein [Inquilinus sp.]|jgi:hypothetical protein|uniref:hypothetical protein n=1 Tax=Inquilinus sp. TaxID=1932117 RepID=UPI00378371E6
MDIITATAPDDPTLPFDGPRGFSTSGLAGLYFMDGTDTTAAIANAAGGAATAVVPAAGQAWAAAALMTNGGINLKGNTYLPGPTIDLTTEWTMFAHLAVGLPTQHDGVTTWLSPILSTNQYGANKGVILYSSVSAGYPSAANAISPNHRWFNSGAQAAAVSLGAPSDVTYTQCYTFATSFKSGNLRSRIFRAGSKVAEVVSAVTIANIVNGVPSQKPTVGTPLQNYAEANLMCEVCGTYTRELSDNDLATADLMSIAVRQGRGR